MRSTGSIVDGTVRELIAKIVQERRSALLVCQDQARVDALLFRNGFVVGGESVASADASGAAAPPSQAHVIEVLRGVLERHEGQFVLEHGPVLQNVMVSIDPRPELEAAESQSHAA